MTDQLAFRRFLLLAESADDDDRPMSWLIDTFDTVPAAVADVKWMMAAGAQLMVGTRFVIHDDLTNQAFDATGEPIAASGAA